MKKSSLYHFLFVALLLLSAPGNSIAQEIRLRSPDKTLEVVVWLQTDKKIYYSVNLHGKELLVASRLGITRTDDNFSEGLKWLGASPTTFVNDHYTLLTGKKRNVKYNANRKIIFLQSANGKKMQLIFQTSNDGVAFRYYFPDKQSDTIFKISAEQTSFHFNENTRTWLQKKAEAQSGWEHCNPSYEENYLMDEPAGTASISTNGFVYPALFKTGDNWVLITEAGMDGNYCGTALKQLATGNEYLIGFPNHAEGMKGKPINPESKLPWYTPWRVIAAGSLATIVGSTLGTDLAKAAIYSGAPYVKPGKAAWSWALGHDETVEYSIQHRFIDYAAEMHWQYCLVDVDWDTRIGYDSIKMLCDYASKKNIGLLLWYNSSGDWNTVKYHPKNLLLTHESRVKEFTRIKAMGVKGVKIDFFAGDGQSMMAYYQQILVDAARFGLMVNFHGATLPRGWSRTYPNLMTAEAVKGFEMITFLQQAADEEAAHCCMLPYTRNAFDPMDFTPMSLYKIPGITRKTTVGFELALSVLFISGIQHYAEGPQGMQQVPVFVKHFLQQVPSTWDEVKFLDGFPGKLVVLARRSGDRWFIAGINGESVGKDIKVDFSFTKGKMKGNYIGDEIGSAGIKEERLEINSNSHKEIYLKPNGGFVIELTSSKN